MLVSTPANIFARALGRWLHWEAVANVITLSIAPTLLVALLIATPVQAQYTDNFQTNLISGLTNNWSGVYRLGDSFSYDALIVQDAGVLSSSGGITMGSSDSSNNILIIADGGAIYGSLVDVGATSSYGNNTMLVTGSDSVWSNTSALYICFGGGNQLTIANGGAVYDEFAYLGYDVGGNNNSVLVTGSGSVWGTTSNIYIGGPLGGFGGASGNQLTIANGGVVNDNNGYVGFGTSNTVAVSGSGAVWNNSGDLTMGTNSEGASQLIVTNGATVYDNNAFLDGFATTASVVQVSGNGATWLNRGNLTVSREGNIINIDVGGSVIASNLYVSGEGGGQQYLNQITVSGGALYVTNNLHDAVLNLNTLILEPEGPFPSWAGMLTLNSGTVTVDSLIMTNNYLYASSLTSTLGGVSFNGGVLSTEGTIISNGFAFIVGNGTNMATLSLATGGSGFHSFANGLTISGNAMLNGIGTIIGATTINGGGTLSPGDAPGSITFSNNLTLASGSTFAVTLNGTAPGQYDQVVGLGPISISNAVLSVSLGYTPSPGDTYTIIQDFGGMAVFGTFVSTSGAALPNGAEFIVDGTTFQIDYAANVDGMDVTLAALIPEPSTWILVAIGMTAVFRLRRRRDHAPS